MSLEVIEELQKGKSVNVQTISREFMTVYEGKIGNKLSFICKDPSYTENIFSYRIIPESLIKKEDAFFLGYPHDMIIYHPSESKYKPAKQMLEQVNLWETKNESSKC